MKLGPLIAATKYFYSCGNSSIQEFNTAPVKGYPANFSAMIFGDWGYLDSVQRPSLPVGAGIQKNWRYFNTSFLLKKQIFEKQVFF